jgi:hypothetical protein
MGGFGAGGKGERGGPKAREDAEVEAIVNELCKGTHSTIIILSYYYLTRRVQAHK